MKKVLSTPPTSAPNDGTESVQSGVQLSRDALYQQRMNEIYDDVQAERCTFDEATDRVVEAIVARTGGWFTAEGRAELAAKVREQCEQDPRLREALGR